MANAEPCIKLLCMCNSYTHTRIYIYIYAAVKRAAVMWSTDQSGDSVVHCVYYPGRTAGVLLFLPALWLPVITLFLKALTGFVPGL